MPAPVLAVLENVRAADWHGIKGCGWRGDGWRVGQGGRATILRFFGHHVCPTFLLISGRFSHSSQNRVPPFAGPPLTSCCFMLTTLAYTCTSWQTESVDTLNKFTKSPVDCSASSEKKNAWKRSTHVNGLWSCSTSTPLVFLIVSRNKY